jgi:hypothetical protein
MKILNHTLARELKFAKSVCQDMTRYAIPALMYLCQEYSVSVINGDVIYLNGGWYVTHAGLLKLAARRHCVGIHVQQIREFCDPATSQWAFAATVFKSQACKGFVGFGDANPSNVSPLVHGAEMRVAETRAVNRALRKAYGIGLCSVEELGASNRGFDSTAPGKIPPQPAAGSGPNGRKVRDQLCQIIRQHQLDPNLVKAYAVDYCGVKSLKDATREQVQNFVKELSDWAEKDRNALLCQLNSYLGNKEGAA